MVITLAIGEWPCRQCDSIRHVNRDHRQIRGDESAQFIHHNGGTDDAAFERQLTCHGMRIESSLPCQHEQFDKGTISLGVFQNTFTYCLNGLGQIPRHEWRTIAQCTGIFSSTDR